MVCPNYTRQLDSMGSGLHIKPREEDVTPTLLSGFDRLTLAS